ncbi:MAG: signal peptidase I [Oceanicoccus sp.]
MMKNWLREVWNGNKALLLFIFLMMVFRSAVADWNEVPTGSMKPTIVEGDRIFVNKMAYDFRIPFTHISLIKIADPDRGDIIIFDSSMSDKRLVKRVVGIPGDRVAMRNNIVSINGQPLSYLRMSEDENYVDSLENLIGVEHFVRMDTRGSALSSFEPIRVPADSYLVLGDNRDNSADSRVIGFVSRNEIVGRSRSVVLSFNYDNYYIPRSGRFFQSL